jgi:hypothetical protein
MRKLLFVLLLLAVGVVALGVYMDWFRFSKGGDQGSGKVDVGVTIDTEKIKSDAEKAKDKVKALGSQAKEPTEGAKPEETVPPK